MTRTKQSIRQGTINWKVQKNLSFKFAVRILLKYDTKEFKREAKKGGRKSAKSN